MFTYLVASNPCLIHTWAIQGQVGVLGQGEISPMSLFYLALPCPVFLAAQIQSYYFSARQRRCTCTSSIGGVPTHVPVNVYLSLYL